MLSKIIKKLNNFKFTAMLVAIISAVSALYALGAIFMYHFAGNLDPQSKGLIRFVGFNGVEGGAYLGMSLFFMALISFFIFVYIAYSLIPFIQNKEKNNPRKGLLLAGSIGGVFQLLLVVFMIILLALGNPNTKVIIIVTLPIGLLSAVAAGLFLIPWLKCDFYMPQIVQK